MAGIYVHIPFCKKACTYCNFHFSTTLSQKKLLLEAIELEIRKEALTSKHRSTIQTVYFGGGTPSILDVEELEKLMIAVRQFDVHPAAEVTLEAHPDDIDPQKLKAWKAAGINRLSVGIQSFNEDELRWMNRAHNAAQAMRCLEDISDAGFTSYSADLIYGSPLLSDEGLLHNLDILVKNRAPHISCYALTVEPKTVLDHNIRNRLSPNVSSGKQSAQFILVMNFLRQAGYEHYEISNFALPGFRSRHNSSYWKGLPYYGFGPSAHSFNGNDIRKWNVNNNSLYAKNILSDSAMATTEHLTESEKWNEFVMISIRTIEGISINRSEREFGRAATENLLRESNQWIQGGKMVHDDNMLFLTDEGKLFADGIAASLFA